MSSVRLHRKWVQICQENCISLSQSVQWDKDKKNVSSLKNNNARLLTINHEKNVIYEPFLTPLHSLRMSTNKIKQLRGFKLIFLKTCPEAFFFLIQVWFRLICNPLNTFLTPKWPISRDSEGKRYHSNKFFEVWFF